MTEPSSVLIVEDESHTRTFLDVTLRQQGYRCIQATNGAEGIAATADGAPGVVLLDLGLPDMSGVEVTRRIRAQSSVPIIVISARGNEEDKITALDAGANDYVTKPFITGELLARIRVALRNARPAGDEPEARTVTIGELTIDFAMRRVTVGGHEVYLTPTEYRLLALMIRSAGRVLTHRQILSRVWGSGYETQTHYLRVYMKRLRYKIEAEPAQPKVLVNEPGVGYRLRLPR